MELGSQITVVICILIELLFLNRNISETPTKYCRNSIFITSKPHASTLIPMISVSFDQVFI